MGKDEMKERRDRAMGDDAFLYEMLRREFEKIEKRMDRRSKFPQLIEDVLSRLRTGAGVPPETLMEAHQAARDANIVPEDAGFFLVAHGADQIAEEGHQEAYDSEFHARFEEIRVAHGLDSDEHWPPGEGPEEHVRLDTEFNALGDKLLFEALLEHDEDEMADLAKTDRLAFDRKRERGRQFFFGPPDGDLADYLRSQGVID